MAVFPRPLNGQPEKAPATALSKLKTAIVYPDSDGAPIAESDPARDYLIYGVEALKLYDINAALFRVGKAVLLAVRPALQEGFPP